MALNDGGTVGALLGLDEPRFLRAVTFERHDLDPIGAVGMKSITLAASDGDEIRCLFLTPSAPAPRLVPKSTLMRNKSTLGIQKY